MMHVCRQILSLSNKKTNCVYNNSEKLIEMCGVHHQINIIIIKDLIELDAHPHHRRKIITGVTKAVVYIILSVG